jgi:hypothetical protein
MDFFARGGISGVTMFIAGPFFLGQQQVFPAFVRKMNVLFIPAFLPLILLISG